MPNFVIKTAFKVRGNALEKALKKAGIQAEVFGRKADKSFKKASRSALTFKGIVGGILSASAVTAGLSALRRGTGDVVNEFVSFDQALVSAGAKFPTMARKGTVAFAELSKAARDIGSQTEFTSAQAAQGLEFLAMAGFNASQATAALPLTVDLATASNMDLARATDIASDALGAFGLQTKDTEKLTANLTRINDVFAKTVTTANTDMEMLFEAMTDGGPTMTTAGQSIETFSAAVGAMANAGIKGSKAGTTLKNAILRLAAPVGKAKTLLKKLKVETADSEGNMRDFFDILGDVERATEGMGSKQRAAAIDTIFSKRAVAGLSVLLDQGADKLKKYRMTLEGSQNASKAMADEMRKSLINKLKTLKSAVIEAGFKFLEAFEDKMPGAIDKAIEAVRGFDMQPVIDGVKTFIGMIGTAVDVIKVLTPVIYAAVGAFIALRVVTVLATLKQWLLNVAMTANPIGIVIGLVGALIGVLIYLIANWDDVVKYFETGWEVITAVFKHGWEFLKDIGLAIGQFFVDVWNAPKKAFFDFIGSIVGAFRKVVTGIGGVITDLFGIEFDFSFLDAAQNVFTGEATVKAPNQAREESRAQQIDFRGQLDITGAPEGTTFTGETFGAPQVQTSIAGASF